MTPPNSLGRREVLQSLLTSGLVAALLPGAAAASWRAVAAMAPGTSLRVLDPAHASLVALIADAILPRTDTPSATDMGVVQWIDAVAADYLSDAKRREFLDGVAAIDGLALSMTGSPLASLPAGAVAGVITGLDAVCAVKNSGSAERGYAFLKELVVYGYFTCETVQKDILKVTIVPGHFDPSVPVATTAAT